MKLVPLVSLLACASAANLTIADRAVDDVSNHLANYEQKGNAIKCKTDAKTDEALGKEGGPLGFASDSLEMCAHACDCRQGCLSFSWVKPEAYDGDSLFVVVADSAEARKAVGDQGKCTLHSSDCSADFQEPASDDTYSFTATNGMPTDVQDSFPRSDGDANEKEITDQVACMLAGIDAVAGYVQVGGGGAFPGVCASGGKYAKLTDLDMDSGGTLEKCRESCNGSSECQIFNFDKVNGVCKFRNQRCKTQWVTGTAQPYTTYVKGTVEMQTGGPSFSSAASTGVTASAALIVLALALLN